MKDKLISIDDLDLTPRQREQHFFNKGYEYAMLHLQIALEKERLKGLEERLMKYLDFVEHQKEEK